MKNVNLVVGAGISGATIANLLANNLNEKVLIIDKRNHIGGNCHDYKDKNGITIHSYGSHIFHTSDEKVWNYVNKFTEFNQYKHKVLAEINNIKTPIPFNFNSLKDLFPKDFATKLEKKILEKFKYSSKIPILEFQNQDDEDLKFIADFIYQNVFLNYTLKQWGFSPENLDKSVTSRVPVYISHDNNYFQDKFQGIPKLGYTNLINKMLDNHNIEIRLNTDFKDLKENFKRIFYTGSIDEFFNYEYGVLPYRSVKFKLEEYDKEFYQENAVINYPNTEKYTRIHEYKYYLQEKSQKTVIAKEYSENFELGKNDRYYPIPRDENNDLYSKYLEKAKSYSNLYFLGRLGDYKYYDMDKAILRAFEVFKLL